MWWYKFIHDLPEWPNFTWRQDDLLDLLAEIRHKQGLLLGRMDALGFDLQSEAELNALTQTVVKTSEIEGELLDTDAVRSSVASRMGVDIGGYVPTHRDVEGIVDVMMNATGHFNDPLTPDRLFLWQALLFPYGTAGDRRIPLGRWRGVETGPMQIVSGFVGEERVHYLAPTYQRLDYEMGLFLDWFNSPDSTDDVLKAALAHFWFVTIHPFPDGNGRMARAIADMTLARSDGVARRFYSMSAQIRNERREYYNVLEATQKGDLDVTNWLVWFLGCLGRALDSAQETVAVATERVKYWDTLADVALNARQQRVLQRVVNGFEGKLTTKKWAKMTKSSQDTALRDITDLLDKGVLERSPAGGRSTSYLLANSNYL